MGEIAVNSDMLYRMIFKRKSFRIFKNIGKITEEELRIIEEIYSSLMPLDGDIKTAIRIVPEKETTCRRGGEYCILLYSEKKGNYLQNIGYIGEQLDLYLASMNIGALWFGIGKVDEVSWNGLDYVIMFNIAKMPEEKFRKDMFKSKRKPLNEICDAEALMDLEDIFNVARFAPSACNTQPWKVEAAEKEIKVYRYKKSGKRGIMPADKVAYYNRIDIGIFLLFLETCLKQKEIIFTRKLFEDNTDDESENVSVACYSLI